MAFYRCYFLDATQHFTDVAEIQSIDDQAALQQARAAFATYAEYSGFELWENRRMIHSEMADRGQTAVASVADDGVTGLTEGQKRAQRSAA
jgi:hypothetical protein